MNLLVGTIVGLIQGLLTEGLKIFREFMQAKMEIAYLEKMTQLEILKKRNGIAYQSDGTSEGDAPDFSLPFQFAKTGFTKIDKFNALLRPLVQLLAVITLVGIIICICVLVFQAGAAVPLTMKVQLLQAGLISDFVLSVLGFLFGYRSAVKLKGR